MTRTDPLVEFWLVFLSAYVVLFPGLSHRQSLMYSLCCWKRNLLPLLRGPGVSTVEAWSLGGWLTFPWGPETEWKRWLLSGEGSGSLHGLSRESSGMTGSWLFPKAPVKTLTSLQSYASRGKACLHRLQLRDFIVIIFRYLEVNLFTPALLQLSQMTHWFIFFTFKLVFRTGFCPQVKNCL